MGTWDAAKMARWVTLYTDAGWQPATKEGRTGFIARGSVGPSHWHRGYQEVIVDSSIAAEALAVLHGLQEVVAHFGPHAQPSLEGVFLRTDCQSLIPRLQVHRDRKERHKTLKKIKCEDHRDAIESIYRFCDHHNLLIYVKWVPAHGKEQDKVKRWMNTQADALGNMRRK